MEHDNLAILLFPGAWHTPEHYASFVAYSRQFHIPIEVAKPPSNNGQCTDLDFEIHLSHASDQLRTLMDKGKNVLLLAHSFGGFLACDAVEIASTIPNGRILGIVFVAAFVPLHRHTFADLFAGAPVQTWMKIEGTQCFVEGASQLFYNEVNEPTRSKLAKTLVPCSTSLWKIPSMRHKWTDYACYYVKCNKDNVLTTTLQQQNIDRLLQAKVMELPDSDHFPFESCAEGLVQILLSVVQETMLH